VKKDREDGRGASVLVINPGSTSTETGLFEASGTVRVGTLDHPEEALEAFEHVLEQVDWREAEIARFIEEEGFETGRLRAVVGRGGLLRPLAGGGTYPVTDAMCDDLKQSRYGEHASNLGALLARRFSMRHDVPCFVVDPVTTDEFDPASRLSGVPGIERKCRNHALSIKAAARRAAERLGKALQQTRLVAAHLGGGISVAAVRGGRIVDSTDALLGEGPFSPERAGTVPLAGVIALCLDSGKTRAEIIRLLSRESGLKGYLGTGRLPDVFRMIDQGNAEARRVLDAMVLQIVKWIGAMAAVLVSRPDAIFLTGGMAHSERFVSEISAYISGLAPLQVFPGSLEMEALAEGAFRVLNGQEDPLPY
jgi:butyrate kinase